MDTGVLGLSLGLTFTGDLQLLPDMYSLANGTPLILITGREKACFRRSTILFNARVNADIGGTRNVYLTLTGIAAGQDIACRYQDKSQHHYNAQ